MYDTTITLFCKYKSALGITWYSYLLDRVHLTKDKGFIAKTYGETSSDNASLYIRFKGDEVGNYKYLPPKEWDKLPNDEKADYITFKSGDFFVAGHHEAEPINDDDYRVGFYQDMVEKYDDVFLINNVSKFDLLPHFEITAK